MFLGNFLAKICSFNGTWLSQSAPEHEDESGSVGPKFNRQLVESVLFIMI